MSSGPADSAKGRVRGALKSFGFIVWVVVFQISCHSLFHAFFSLFYWEPCRGEIPSARTPGEPAWAATSLVHCSALPTVETVSTHELNMVLSASPTYRPTVTPTQVPNALLWCFFFPLSVFQRAHCRLTNAELQTNITLNVSKGPSPAPHRFPSPAKVCFFSLHSHWTVI